MEQFRPTNKKEQVSIDPELLRMLLAHVDEDERLQALILAKLTDIEKIQSSSLELLNVFNNTKGFITTLKNIGLVLFWVAAVSAALTAVGYAIKQWLRG